MPILHKFIYGCIGIIIFGVLFFAYLVFWDGTKYDIPITVQSLTTQYQIYHHDDVVDAYINYCKPDYLDSSVKWSLLDTYLKYFPEAPTPYLAPGCHSLLIPIEQIPDDTYPDTYHFSGDLRFKVNPFRSVDIIINSNTFKVK